MLHCVPVTPASEDSGADEMGKRCIKMLSRVRSSPGRLQYTEAFINIIIIFLWPKD